MADTIGITGGIGAGKSTVLNCFQALGAAVLEADQVAHSAYAPGTPVYQQLVERWGPDIVDRDGGIHRRAVADIVFRQPDQLQWLNKIIHPWVREKIKTMADGLPGQLLFCAVPLLYEAGWERDFKKVISVWCDAGTRNQRLRARGWSTPEIEQRLQNQWTMDEKAEKADFIIVNNGSRRILDDQCRRLYRRLRQA